MGTRGDTPLAAGILAGLGLVDSRPAPSVVRTLQLTHDGLPKFDNLVTDGVRLYFGQGNGAVQLAVTGGETVPLFTGWRVLAISPAGYGLLVERDEHDTADPNQPLASIHLPSGTPFPLGMKGQAGAWSPDGERLLYANGATLYLAGKNGGGPKHLVTAPGPIDSIAWSPDGTRIRFAVTGANLVRSRWQVLPDGSRLQEVEAPFLAGMEGGGSWTPDGRYFVFAGLEATNRGLWVIRESRGWLGWRKEKAFQITDGTIGFTHPVVSSDGRIFAFGQVNRAELMRYQTDTRNTVPYLPGLWADGLAYSPDGQFMVWVALADRTLWRSRADGSERVQLTSSNLEEVQMARWSPDGSTIAFTARPAGKIQRMRLYRVQPGEERSKSCCRPATTKPIPTGRPMGR